MVIALRIRRASDAMINQSQSDTRILFSNGAGKWMHYPQGGPRRARITYTHTRDPYPWTRQGPPRWAGAPLGRLKSPGQNLPVGTAQDSLKPLPQCVRRPALPCRNWKLFAALDLPFPFVPIACYHRRAGLPSKYTLDALIPDRGELPSALCVPLLALGTWTEPSPPPPGCQTCSSRIAKQISFSATSPRFMHCRHCLVSIPLAPLLVRAWWSWLPPAE